MYKGIQKYLEERKGTSKVQKVNTEGTARLVRKNIKD